MYIVVVSFCSIVVGTGKKGTVQMVFPSRRIEDLEMGCVESKKDEKDDFDVSPMEPSKEENRSVARKNSVVGRPDGRDPTKRRSTGVALGTTTNKLATPGRYHRSKSLGAPAGSAEPLPNHIHDSSARFPGVLLRSHQSVANMKLPKFAPESSIVTIPLALHPMSRFVPRKNGGNYDRHYHGQYSNVKLSAPGTRVFPIDERLRCQVEEMTSGRCVSGEGLPWPVFRRMATAEWNARKEPVPYASNVTPESMPPAGVEVDVVPLHTITETSMSTGISDRAGNLARLKTWAIAEADRQLRKPEFGFRAAKALKCAAELGVELSRDGGFRRMETVFSQLAAISQDYMLLLEHTNDFLVIARCSIVFAEFDVNVEAHTHISANGEISAKRFEATKDLFDEKWRQLSISFPSLRNVQNAPNETEMDSHSDSMEELNPLAHLPPKLTNGDDSDSDDEENPNTPVFAFLRRTDRKIAWALRERFMEDLVYCCSVATALSQLLEDELGAEVPEVTEKDRLEWSDLRMSRRRSLSASGNSQLV